jgi:hypothetical protein
MALSREQRRVAQTLVKVGRRKHVPRRLKVAALATGLTESSLRNLKYGDADSQGWRQERKQYYSNPTNVRASAARFYDEAKSDIPGGASKQNLKKYSIAQISQYIQASAYPSRYAENAGEARQILAQLSGKKLGGGGTTAARGGESSKQVSTTKKLTKPTQAAALSLIQNRFSPGAFIDYATAEKATTTRKVDRLQKGKTPKGKTSQVKVKGPQKGERLGGSALEIGKKVAKRFGLTITSTTGGTHAPGSYHYQGRAIDISGSPAAMKAARKYIGANVPHAKLTELFYDGFGAYFDNGHKIKGQLGDHGDHIHLAL